MHNTAVRFPVFGDELLCEFVGHRFVPATDRIGTLQVLVHGNSYDHRYWDAEVVNGTSYSYIEYMMDRGYDVLAVDLPGTGDSERPATDAVGFAEIGAALAAAISRTREASSPQTRVALVGHSLGTILSVYTQAWWGIADVLVGTGVGFSSSQLPSPYGPGVRERLLDDPYPNLPAELREDVFYHLPTADPEMVAYDTRVLRTVLPRKLWSDSIDIRNDPELAGLSHISCPVLLQLGEFDPVLPGSFASAERQLWPGNTDITVEQVDGMGHLR